MEYIADAAAVCDWLPEGLQSCLPEGVTADLAHLGLSGHSCGGYEAFALALGHAKTNLKFSALIAVDPVAGTGRWYQVSPKILTYVPSYFALDFPVLVFGTGLGSQWNWCFPPEGVNHDEFYRESRPTCYHIVAKDYDHLEMLDDGVEAVEKLICKCGANDRGKDAMRRRTAGVMTAFLKAYLAYLCGEGADLDAVVSNPGLAPGPGDARSGWVPPETHLVGVIRSRF